MPNISHAVRDTSMDLESLLGQNTGDATPKSEAAAGTSGSVEAAKSPLEELAERKGSGFEVNPSEIEAQQVRSGQLRDESIEAVHQTLDEMDQMIEKAQMLKIERPGTPEEMAATMEALSSVSIDDVRAARNASDTEDLLKEHNGSAVGIELGAETPLAVDGKGSLAGGLFKVKGEVSGETVPETEDDYVKRKKREQSIQLIVDKTGYGPNIDFTKEELEKLRVSSQIDLVQVENKELQYIKVKDADDGFLGRVRTDLHKMIGATSEVPLVGSRLRVTFRGLTYGEYANLGLSHEITEVENFNTRCVTYYNALRNTSIGGFTSYDEFLKNVAAIDMPIMTFGLYVATNPEHMDIGVKCNVEKCGAKFRHPFVPRTLLDLEHASDRFLEIMEQVSTVEAGLPAKKYHEASSLITRTRVVLPHSKITVDLGLTSCFDMIHYRLPFLADAEKLLVEKYPEDTSLIHALIPNITDTVAAVILNVDGEDVRVTDIVAMADILYNVPYEDYEILMSITEQTNADYRCGFVVKNVDCPKCKTHTDVVPILLDDEIFTQLRTRGSTSVNPKTLPRL